MVLLLAAAAAGAGAVGLAGYALGKRRERRDIANGYVTYSGNGTGQPRYANLHYGRSARNYRGRQRTRLASVMPTGT
jgi:hypothetical protein